MTSTMKETSSGVELENVDSISSPEPSNESLRKEQLRVTFVSF